MPVSESQKKAMKKYREKNIELVAFETKKGKSAEYTQAATELGLGKMEMIRLAIEEFIARHRGEDCPPAEVIASTTRAEKLTADQRRLLDEFGKMPVDVQKKAIALIRTINAAQDTPKSTVTAD